MFLDKDLRNFFNSDVMGTSGPFSCFQQWALQFLNSAQQNSSICKDFSAGTNIWKADNLLRS